MLKEIRRLAVSENGMQRRIFEYEKHEVTEIWRKLLRGKTKIRGV
jgi:hypothetical protein